MAFIPALISAAGSLIGSAGSAIAGGGISSALGALGTVAGAVSSFAAASYQSKLAKVNAQISRDNAQRSIQEAGLQRQQQDDRTRALLGEQIALQGASGLSLGGRSQILSRKTAAELGRKDALNIQYAGEVEKVNYLNQAAGQEASAKLYKSQGVGDLLGGFLGAAGSLVGNARSTRKSFAPIPTARPRSL